MAQFAAIQKAQQSLEECVTKKMDELQAQLQMGSAKDTVAKVAEEFRTFRELTYSMLSLLQKQIAECTKVIDVMDTRQRRKYLIFSGVHELNGENCGAVLLDVLHSKLQMKELTAASITTCHRLGSASKDHHRPILVKFASFDTKTAVWRAKTRLKGCSISVKEFLTKARQSVFGKARLHFGVRGCWTQDGTIVVKASDGSRHKLTSMEELEPLLTKYTKVSSGVVTNTASR